MKLIVVDNGSTEELNVEVLQIWNGVRVHKMENPTSSPAPAVNFGLSPCQRRYLRGDD